MLRTSRERYIFYKTISLQDNETQKQTTLFSILKFKTILKECSDVSTTVILFDSLPCSYSYSKTNAYGEKPFFGQDVACVWVNACISRGCTKISPSSPLSSFFRTLIGRECQNLEVFQSYIDNGLHTHHKRNKYQLASVF